MIEYSAGIGQILSNLMLNIPIKSVIFHRPIMFTATRVFPMILKHGKISSDVIFNMIHSLSKTNESVCNDGQHRVSCSDLSHTDIHIRHIRIDFHRVEVLLIIPFGMNHDKYSNRFLFLLCFHSSSPRSFSSTYLKTFIRFNDY